MIRPSPRYNDSEWRVARSISSSRASSRGSCVSARCCASRASCAVAPPMTSRWSVGSSGVGARGVAGVAIGSSQSGGAIAYFRSMTARASSLGVRVPSSHRPTVARLTPNVADSSACVCPIRDNARLPFDLLIVLFCRVCTSRARKTAHS